MTETIDSLFTTTIAATAATAVTLDATCAAVAGHTGTALDVPALPAWPDLTVEISFTTSLDDEPEWTDVTDDVRQLSIKRGRNYELDRTETGTCTVVLENRERDYEPGWPLSPYWPNVTPGRPIRVSATWLGDRYELFRGQVEAWPIDWQGGFDSAQAAVTAVDGFEQLARGDVTVTCPKEWTGQRVNRVLDSAGWPTERRQVDLGSSYTQAVDLVAENALTQLQNVADTELGWLYVNGAGDLVFRSRSARATPPAHRVLLGDDDDDPSELAYDDAPLEYGLDKVFTEVPVTRTGGYEQRAVDTTARQQWGRRVMPSRTGLWTADVVAAQVAQFLLERHANPRVRFTSVQLDPVANPGLWQQTLGAELGDVARISRRPPGGGAPIVQDCWIEGVSHDFDTTKRWRTVWNLTATYTATVTVNADGVDQPVNTAPPRVNGQTVVADTLKITTVGSWYDTAQQAIVYAYRWQTATPTTFVDLDTGDERTVPADGTIADIPGAAAYTYTISGTYEGRLIRAAVDGRNSAGVGTGYSTWDGPVTLTPPDPVDEPPDGGDGSDTTGTHTFELDVDFLDDPEAILG